jgi:hypothetical protein
MPHDQRLRTLPPEDLRDPTLAFPRALAAREKLPLFCVCAPEKAPFRCDVDGCVAGVLAVVRGGEFSVEGRAAGVLGVVEGRVAALDESP